MKRSVSPQTVTEPESGPASKKRRFLGIVTSLATRLFSPSEASKSNDNVSANNGGFDTEELPVEYVSHKRRSSVHASLKNANQEVPRMSTVVPHLKSYSGLTQSLETEREAINGAHEHERRQSILPPSIPDYAGNYTDESAFLKDLSPNLNNMPGQGMLRIAERDMEYNNSDDMDEGQLQLAEPEFAPLYQDEDGNLVRPPFINLDPNERYHLLQLKRSVEMSEYLQKRLKYMVDPDETTSVPTSGNKVNSATQTHGVDEFDRKLNFNNLRSKLSTARRQRQQRNGRGFFSGEFFYEPQPPKKVPEPAATKDSLNGYLGEIQKPKFEKPKSQTSTKPLPDQETLPSIDLDKNRRSDLGAMLTSGTKDEGGLDQNYLDKAASLIKMKEPVNGSTTTDPSTGPSRGFNFEISKKNVGSILQTRKEDDDRVDKANAVADTKNPVAEANRALFGLPAKASSQNGVTPQTEKPAPSFSFGGSKKATSVSATDDDNEDKPRKIPKPTFSFGNNQTSTNANEDKKSSELFSKKSEPLSLFGSKTSSSTGALFGSQDESQTKAPLFSLGTSKKRDASPTFSFGKSSSEKTSGTKEETPKFSFGTESATPSSAGEKEATPAFNAENSKEQSSKPSFNFGSSSKVEKPASASDSEKATGPAKSTPLFSLGKPSESKDSTPFSFGDKSDTKEATPKFSFGGSQDSKSEKPLFSGGALTDKTTAVPQFNFGGSAEKKEDSAPQFNFGASTDKKSASSLFGSIKPSTDGDSSSVSKPQASETSSLDAKKELPKFTFGGSSESKAATPAFSFGSKSETAEANANDSKPAVPKFDFKSSTSAPQFSFESKSEEPKGTSAAPQFSFGGTKSVSPSFGSGSTKPAEVSFGASNTSAISGKESTPVFSVSSKETTPKPFSFGSASTKPSLNFGATQQPAFGADSKTASAFSFGKSETPPIGMQNNGSTAGAPQPAFSFGSSATADPASIFGAGAGAKAPAAQPSTAFGGPSVGVSSTASPFNFGNTQAPSFGGATGVFGGANPNQPAFNFGSGTNLANPQPTQSSFLGNQATSSVFGSRGSTPGAGGTGFGQANPASVFGNTTQPNQAFGMNNAPSVNQFNSAPGSLAAGSRENTPPVFGAGAQGAAPGAPGAPGAFGAGQSFTPPLAMKGRRIAQMRPRRR